MIGTGSIHATFRVQMAHGSRIVRSPMVVRTSFSSSGSLNLLLEMINLALYCSEFPGGAGRATQGGGTAFCESRKKHSPINSPSNNPELVHTVSSASIDSGNLNRFH
jgi:hypothetical protein